ncbi:hypothetical protein PHLCEN_2v6006 [Hermanssonia centrifuga]|uniref:Uncharacterized protein n=1 Tax=Hermanssonia centrifuga TaxID=98765 RepID=A0A2R6P0N4_9APHY|nr:hypothetical protein PHLCEN_2v6006 [Hermanssonia centrifuga]
MSSDNRFMYQSAQEVPTSYAYSQYSQYDTTQYASPPRPVRNGAPAQPPPHSQHYPTPTNGYPPPPGYSGPAYGVTPSQNTPQWSSENWSQFPSPFSQPHPPIQEAQSFPSDSRPEIQSQSSGEPKGPPTGSQKLDNRRKDEQTSRQVEAPHQPKGRKTREDEIPVPPPVPALPSAPLGLDFMKIPQTRWARTLGRVDMHYRLKV